ncbi:MAG: DNA polymerase III subunit gamma/tau [Lachnospiraceae bacterium]|nr:DNA polymerase III subunit gamma/tau [Lachnospiraceae bacterium]
MSYMALYRKFRPREFSEVKGQDHIVSTLKNQIKTDRIGHAYLFVGTRGTGKTTMAKLFSKAINCESPREDGSPCGQCACCRSADAGSSMNVIEMDAASNNGVDDVRRIIEEVSYPPTEGRYKVYIIDEVHMLSTAAFNALLKTLEEPPSYVIFILATTEPHKLPVTILSRCQRYDFHRISNEIIASRLRELTDAEGVQIEERALSYIARAGDGSMRDAISLLDQCIAFYLGEELTFDKALLALGAVDTDIFSRLTRCITIHDVAGALSVLDEVVGQGRELSQFITDFIWYLRNLMLIKSGGGMEDALDMTSDNVARLKEEAAQLELPVIFRYIRVLSDLSAKLRFSTQKRVITEIGLITLCRPQMEDDAGSIVERLISIEDKLEGGEYQSAAAMPMMPSEPVEKVPFPDALPEEVEDLARRWPVVMAGIESGMMRTMLAKALVSATPEGHILLVYDMMQPEQRTALEYMTYTRNEKLINKLALEEYLSGEAQANIIVDIKGNEASAPKEKMYTSIVDAIARATGTEVIVEDF